MFVLELERPAVSKSSMDRSSSLPGGFGCALKQRSSIVRISPAILSCSVLAMSASSALRRNDNAVNGVMTCGSCLPVAAGVLCRSRSFRNHWRATAAPSKPTMLRKVHQVAWSLDRENKKPAVASSCEMEIKSASANRLYSTSAGRSVCLRGNRKCASA